MELEVTQQTEVPTKDFQGRTKSDSSYWFDRFLEVLTKKLTHGHIVKIPLERLPYKHTQSKIKRFSRQLLRDQKHVRLSTATDDGYLYIKKLGDGSLDNLELNFEHVNDLDHINFRNEGKSHLLVKKASQTADWIKVNGENAAKELNYASLESLYGTLKGIDDVIVRRRNHNLYIKSKSTTSEVN